MIKWIICFALSIILNFIFFYTWLVYVQPHITEAAVNYSSLFEEWD